MPLFTIGSFELFLGRSSDGYLGFNAGYTENKGTPGALENGIKASVKLDSVTSRIGTNTKECVINSDGSEVYGKETKILGATLGRVEPETMLGAQQAKFDAAQELVNGKERPEAKPTLDTTAAPA